MQPPGRGPKGGVAGHRSAAGMRVAAHRAVPLCLRVQWETPHHHSQPRLLLPVRKLCWQQPAREGGAGVRFTLSASQAGCSSPRLIPAGLLTVVWCLCPGCARGPTLYGATSGTTAATTSTLCTGRDTARLRGSSDPPLPPTVSSKHPLAPLFYHFFSSAQNGEEVYCILTSQGQQQVIFWVADWFRCNVPAS